MVFRLASLDLLTNEVIKRMINKFKQTEIPRLNKLYNYYLDKNAVLLRTQEDETKPNNKIAHPYAKYITDTFTGYFMGEPVAYLSDENIEPYKAILAYNDEEQENTNLARDCSIFGRAWEELYIDDDGQIRFTIIDPREVIAVYDEKIDDELLAVVRFYEKYNVVDDKTYLIVEVFNKDEVVTYQTGLGVDYLTEIDRKQLAFGFVPFVLYKNNKDDLGDYEEVLTLIDAYDSLVSDGINDFDYFCDAYLALYGYTADSDDIAQMKKNRVLLMDQGTNAEFLIKDGDSAGLETTKSRLEKDIHKFAFVPNSSDESFSGNTSGVAMRYKLLGTENVASIKEQYFRKALINRAEIISTMMPKFRLPSFDFRGLTINFTRNLPVNEDDVTAMVKNLNGVVSKETLLAQLPFIADAKEELDRLQKEQAQSVYNLVGYKKQQTESE